MEMLIVCVFAFTGVSGSHMQGGTISFRAREKHLDGWTVDFRYKSSFIYGSANYFYWYCLYGDCGYETERSIGPVDNRTSFPGSWYQYEGRITRRAHNDKPFQLLESSCCWVYNLYSASGWQLTTSVDLGIRSDTKKPNSSPVTSPIPIVRIPQNCATTVSLLAHDPDGDSVRCRYGYYYGECSRCSWHFGIDQEHCTLSVPSRMTTGSYVLELVLEDFPSEDIRLTYNDGTIQYKYRTFSRKIREVPEKYAKNYWYETTTFDAWGSGQQTVTEAFTDISEAFYSAEDSTTMTGYITTDIYVTEQSTDIAGEEYPTTITDCITTDIYVKERPTDIPGEEYPTTITDRITTDIYVTERPTDIPGEDTTTITDRITTDIYVTERPTDIPGEEDTTTVTYYTTKVIYLTERSTDIPGEDTTTITDRITTDIYVTERPTDIPTERAGETVAETVTAAHFTDLTTVELVKASTGGIMTEAVTIPYETTITGLYSDSLSKISLQFIVEVTSPAPSCKFGDYRPRFLPPTPNQGERLLTTVESVFQLHLSAHAAYERITDFKVSGPSGITKEVTARSRSNTISMTVEWMPEENDLGDHVPFCFVAETSNGYQSEMRCVIVVVGPSKLENTILTCHENTMTFIIGDSPDNELYENNFRLNDPNCLVTSNSTHLIASVGYNSCGTEIEETEHAIVFKNQVTSFANISSVITRKHGVSIPFNCSFPKETRLSASFLAHKSDYMFSEAGFGNFTYKFQFYTDDRFVEVEAQYPLEVTLRDPLYLEIQVSSAVPNVQLFVESCKATPHDDPNDPIFYDIIQNGCINDDTLVIYPGTRTQNRFAMEAFAFIGSYEEVYISCTVILCKLGEPGTRCNQGCVRKSLGDSDGRRRRRSLVSESQQHFISQGPLRMRKPPPSDAGDTHSLNVNTLVIALSGVVIAALGTVTVHMYTKKSRATSYKRLDTQEI